MIRRLRIDKAWSFVTTRHHELLSLMVGVGQVGLNFWLAVALKTDPKAQRNGNIAPSSQQSVLHQQMGLVTTPIKPSPLTTAHQLTMFGQQGNYNFGIVYPDYKFIRALVSLYLVTAMLHTVHSRIMFFIRDHQRQRKFSTFFTILVIITLTMLDIAVVNDLIVISSNEHNMTALAVNDVYTSSTTKGRNKEYQQYLDYLVSSIILGYRWIQMFFLVTSLWTRDLKPFIRGRKGMVASTRLLSEPPEPSKQVTSLSPPKLFVPLKEQQKPAQTVGKRKGGRKEKPKKGPSAALPNDTPPQKLLRNVSISSQSSFQPLQFSKNQSTMPESKTTDKQETTRSSTTRRSSRQVRSESYAHSHRDSAIDLPRSLSEMTKKVLPSRDFHLNVHGHRFKFALETPKGAFSFETNSVSEFNKRLDEISNLNNWHDFVLLNVKLRFWKDAYERVRIGPARNVVKGELVKLISQYSLSLINQQQNFGHPMVDFE